ncbi:hypothetical protein [Neobacillus terrae]|nr:hypothetical protein [Neobacillus terrae]
MTIEQAKTILMSPEIGQHLTREEMDAIKFLISETEHNHQK